MQSNVTGTYQPKPLPWPLDALTGFVSAETNRAHYNDHYLHYVEQVNKSGYSAYPIIQLMLEMLGPISQASSQIWNHEFFWGLLKPNPEPISGPILALIVNHYESFEHFKEVFAQRISEHFASGWIWVAWDPTTRLLYIIDGQDDYNPLKEGLIPLLTLDMWEHSLLDYGTGARKKEYGENFWKFVDWSKVNRIVQENITSPPLVYTK